MSVLKYESIKDDPLFSRHAPMLLVLNILDKKWNMAILLHIFESDEELGFNQLKKLIPDISDSVLALHLKDLEKLQLIVRYVYPSTPPKVKYSLSEFGITLLEQMNKLYVWGLNYALHMEIFKDTVKDCKDI